MPSWINQICWEYPLDICQTFFIEILRSYNPLRRKLYQATQGIGPINYFGCQTSKRLKGSIVSTCFEFLQHYPKITKVVNSGENTSCTTKKSVCWCRRHMTSTGRWVLIGWIYSCFGQFVVRVVISARMKCYCVTRLPVSRLLGGRGLPRPAGQCWGTGGTGWRLQHQDRPSGGEATPATHRSSSWILNENTRNLGLS